MVTERVVNLPITPVDPASPIPLYHQVEIDLRHLIATGQLKPSMPLPPETLLGKAYGVGRHTMRMALSRLAGDRLISRKAGRGTVVTAPENSRRFYLDRSFTRQLEEMGLIPGTRLLEARVGTFDEGAPETFRARIGESYLRLLRLRLGDGQPIGLQDAIIPLALCPGLERYDFSQRSLYGVLASDYDLMIMSITHTVSASAATAQQAHLLSIPSGAPLLKVQTDSYVSPRTAIEHTVSYYRSDRYEFSTTHTLDT